MKLKQVITMLGSSRVLLSGIIPAIEECTEMLVLLATTSDALNGIDRCEVDNVPDIQYRIMYADDTEDSLSSFLDTMAREEVQVGVIRTTHKFFSEMLKNANGGILFSACREGLYLTYLPLMEEYITKPTHIFVFDNDEQIVIEAKKRCENPNIKIHKCIVHSVCNSRRYDYINHTVHLTSGTDCVLVFPPEVLDFKVYFNSCPIFGRADFVFTESDEAFHFYALWKPVGINALHTLASVKAYVKGVSEGMTLSNISNMLFSEIVPREEMLKHILNVNSVLYDKLLAPYAEAAHADKEMFTIMTSRFINGLYELREKVGRGLDPMNSAFHSKLERHFPILRSADDLETITLLDNFLKLL